MLNRSLQRRSCNRESSRRGDCGPKGQLTATPFLFDQTNVGNTSGYITPLLFEQTSPGIYTVIGIGKGFEVHKN